MSFSGDIIVNYTRMLRLVGCSLLLGGATLPALGAAPTACADLKNFKPAGYAVEIDRAEDLAAVAGGGPAGGAGAGGPPGPPRAALPAHCRIDGTIDKRTGRNNKPYAIGFAVALPKNWNGRFYFQGGGGLNGAVSAPTGTQFAGDSSALAQGYAVASTDSGHKGSGFDASFFEDQEAALNFLYQAIGKVTEVGKQIVAKHYGRDAEFSYFVGCSTGGREAMIMSQRFPNFFDGIVAGAPAMRTGYSNLGLRIASEALNEVAPRDEQGRPQTNQALSETDRKLVVDRFVAACDALDGRQDGLVFATRSCAFDPEVLTCTGGKNAACLTAAQVKAVKVVMGEKKASDGRQIYPGYLYDTGIATTRGLAGVLVGTPIPEGAAVAGPLNVDAAAALANDARAWAGDSNGWTNLSSFHGGGGKLLFVHGVSDPWFSSLDTIQYYERLAADNAPTPLKDWSRLFLVPGMGHCSGGERTLDRFNLVEAISNWVEKDKAPEQIIATGTSLPGESRPLCPYPAHPHYNGSGDAKSAASYSCRE
jgi:feruloyl esterase